MLAMLPAARLPKKPAKVASVSWRGAGLVPASASAPHPYALSACESLSGRRVSFAGRRRSSFGSDHRWVMSDAGAWAAQVRTIRGCADGPSQNRPESFPVIDTGRCNRYILAMPKWAAIVAFVIAATGPVTAQRGQVVVSAAASLTEVM